MRTSKIPQWPQWVEDECAIATDSITQNRKPLTDGVAGLRVVRLLESSNQSIKQKGKVIKL